LKPGKFPTDVEFRPALLQRSIVKDYGPKFDIVDGPPRRGMIGTLWIGLRSRFDAHFALFRQLRELMAHA
jgi:hypothetical protein